jgi:CO/xanthine dehydrogenase Mo-binding subunit
VSGIPAPEAPGKADENLRVINKPIKRHDAREKIAGATRYAADFSVEGMLHTRLVRSPVPSARVVARDVTEALQIPGVVAVLLGEDVPNNDVWVDIPGHTTELSTMKANMKILATDRVRYQGEPVALIVAETEDVLADAEAAVRIEYEDLPGVYDPEEALKDGAPLVHDTGNLLAEWMIDRGDVDVAFASADVLVEGAYTTQFADHAYLETEAGIAWVDDNGVINIRVSTQVIEHFRDVARILGVPDSKVRVIAPYVGGGFGGKEDMTVEPYVALVAHRFRRPARMLWTRQESLLARPKRHRMTLRYRTAARRDGMLLGHDVEIIADGGAYAYLSALVLLYSSVTAGGPYRVPNMRLRARAVYTNHPPCSAFRGFGAMQVAWGYEAQMDKLAQTLEMDPGEIRKRNAIRQGDELPVGQPIETKVWLAETIDAVYEAAGELPAPSGGGPSARDAGPRCCVGRGIASNIQPYGRLVWLNDSASAWIGFELDGSLTIRIGVPDIGGGQASSLIQIASEILGVPLDRIAIHIGDSALTPLAGTTTATRQLYMSGNAVCVAARQLRDQILQGVSQAIDEAPEALALDEHGVRVLTPGGTGYPLGVVPAKQAGYPAGGARLGAAAGGARLGAAAGGARLGAAAGRVPSGCRLGATAGRVPSGCRLGATAGRVPSGCRLGAAAGRVSSGCRLAGRLGVPRVRRVTVSQRTNYVQQRVYGHRPRCIVEQRTAKRGRPLRRCSLRHPGDHCRACRCPLTESRRSQAKDLQPYQEAAE